MHAANIAADSAAPSAGTVHIHTPDGSLEIDKVEVPGGDAYLRARGIQYAEHPIGALRWQPPVRVSSWTGVRKATGFSDDCVNAPFGSQVSAIGSASQSEKCLFLNVWAPVQEVDAKPKAVMLWIHGGSFFLGGSTAYGMDKTFNSQRDVIVVTANYRLGVLGWLSGKAVQRNTTDGRTGNFGLQDTREALRWIQRNIAAFGGDPSKITIFGESAGSSMVACHLVSAPSNGLFSQAVMQSGAFDNYTVQLTPEDSFKQLSAMAGCGDEDTADALECLRSIPLWNPSFMDRHLYQIISNMTTAAWGPVVDGIELTANPLELALEGKFNHVDGVILGTNRDEGRYLMPILMPMPNAPHSDVADLHSWIDTYYPGIGKQILQLYAPDLAKLGAWNTAALIYTESQYLCPTQQSAKLLAEANIPNFLYRLDYACSQFEQVGNYVYWSVWCEDYTRCDNITAQKFGVAHSADVYLLFNATNVCKTVNDSKVTESLRNYWHSFSISGNPNNASQIEQAEWPAFNSHNVSMTLDLQPVAVPQLRKPQCDFWAAVSHGGLPGPPP